MSFSTSFGGYDDGENYDCEQPSHSHPCPPKLTNGDAAGHTRSAIVCECANKDTPAATMESENRPHDAPLDRSSRRPLPTREQH